MTVAANLGFPRIGHRRELKTALETYWAGDLDDGGLRAAAAALRARHWKLQARQGIGHIPSGDFSLYDHVLDTACMLGVIPPGYGWTDGPVPLASYFALARGSAGQPALEMTKWFDTNYHYLVPRLSAGQRFTLTHNHALACFREAEALSIRTRPVLLGPVSFLMLSKTDDGSDPLDLLPALLPVYAQILEQLADANASWVQIDEPVLALDLSEKAKDGFRLAYDLFARGRTPDILLASYFGPLGDNLPTAAALPVAGLHLDLMRGAGELDAALSAIPAQRWLSLGIVDGRNVWRTGLRTALAALERVAARRGNRRLMVAPSCSLLHVPVDLRQETKLAPSVKGWLAFAEQKLDEVRLLTLGLDQGAAAIAPHLEASDAAMASRRRDPAVHRPDVGARLAAATPDMEQRDSPFPHRRAAQDSRLGLPLFPTTTIGSFPQTPEVRQARSAMAQGRMTETAYERKIEAWIDEAVRWQEDIGLDVLVHGEFERNDMVKYFGEQLDGFAFTQHGWVQSYGSRCVAPPVIWGDVARPRPMTVRWSAYARSRTARPMKGMLTGPVTILQWSFVRDDLPREVVCRQIALAIRDEVADLETAGIPVIQVDEPAFREGLPLRRADWADYLLWAVACFRLATSCVRNETSIHTHMCYSAFNDIMPAIAAMDADAISIETTRSRMELLDAFATGQGAYPAGIGPGIWDIHSPRVPGAAEMGDLLRLARDRLEDWQIWVNPDCGLNPAMGGSTAGAGTPGRSGAGIACRGGREPGLSVGGRATGAALLRIGAALRRLRPDRLGRRDRLREHRHRHTVAILHDAQFRTPAAALFVVTDASIREQIGRPGRQVHRVQRRADLFPVGGPRHLDRFLQDHHVGVWEDRVMAEPRLFCPFHEALTDFRRFLARPVRQRDDQAFDIFRRRQPGQFGHAPMAAAADQRHFLGVQAELGEFFHQQLVVANGGRLQQHEIRLARPQFLHDRCRVRQRRREYLVDHQGQTKFLEHGFLQRLVKADGRCGIIADDRDFRGLLAGGFFRQRRDQRHDLSRLGVGGGGGLENVLEATAGDQVGIRQRQPGQVGAFGNLGQGQGEAGQPGAEAAGQVGFGRDHALRGVLGFFGGIARVEFQQFHFGAAQGLDAAGGVDVVDGHAGAHLLQDAAARPGTGQRHEHGDLDVGGSLRAGAKRCQSGRQAEADGGSAGKVSHGMSPVRSGKRSRPWAALRYCDLSRRATAGPGRGAHGPCPPGRFSLSGDARR